MSGHTCASLAAARAACADVEARWAEAPRCTCPPRALQHVAGCPVARERDRLRHEYFGEQSGDNR
jgi:hypothetical protein